RRHVAPFLWSRGIRSIDDVILSHADLDHYNGLPDLFQYFSVHRVICTPTFSDKNTRGVRKVLERLSELGCVPRIVVRGEKLRAGDVEMRVLHPPELGPPGNENARS